MQALHFVFAFGALVAPLLAQPFLQDSSQSLNNNNVTNSSALNATPITRDICKTLNPTSHKTMPVTWAYWIGSVPLAITFVGFLIFVFSKACSLQESEIQEEDPSKAKQGSLIYRMVILSLFSLFLLLYVGFEVAYGGYIFTFGRTARPTLDEDTAAFLTSAFWGSFAFGRLASVPVASHVDKSFSCARKSVLKKHFGVGLVPSVLQLCGQREPLKTYFQFCYFFFTSKPRIPI